MQTKGGVTSIADNVRKERFTKFWIFVYISAAFRRSRYRGGEILTADNLRKGSVSAAYRFTMFSIFVYSSVVPCKRDTGPVKRQEGGI